MTAETYFGGVVGEFGVSCYNGSAYISSQIPSISNDQIVDGSEWVRKKYIASLGLLCESLSGAGMLSPQAHLRWLISTESAENRIQLETGCFSS